MLKNIIRVSTATMERSEWLARRKGSIGGSDASSLIGLNPYGSAYSVWADKTGKLPDKPDNEATRQGRDLEDYVATRFCEETGKRVRREKSMLYNPAYPYAHADIDRWVIGENAGLECKTTSVMNLKRFKGGAFPATYYVQCMHYMAVTGADRWYLAVLIFGTDFHHFVIERDEEEIAALMEQEEAFWKLVQKDTSPAPDGSVATTEALTAIYAEPSVVRMELFGRDNLLKEYQDLTKEIKEKAERLRTIKQAFMMDLGEAEEGLCGSYCVSWKKQKRAFISRDKLLAAYPRIDLSKVMRSTAFRQFRIREYEHATDKNLPG